MYRGAELFTLDSEALFSPDYKRTQHRWIRVGKTDLILCLATLRPIDHQAREKELAVAESIAKQSLELAGRLLAQADLFGLVKLLLDQHRLAISAQLALASLLLVLRNLDIAQP